MLRAVFILIFSGLLLMNLCGCVPLLAGAAGGAGTAVWLSGKLSQEVNAPYKRTIKAVKSGLNSLKLDVVKETIDPNSAQIMSKYTDGKTIWVDVHRLSDSRSKIEVRVGAVNGDKEAENKIFKRIISYL